MQTSKIEFSREEATALMRKYMTHRHHQSPVDDEILRISKLIAKGRIVIRAVDSIIKAGVNADGLPKLALARADAKKVFLNVSPNGAAIMHLDARSHWVKPNMAASRRFDLPAGFLPTRRMTDRFSATVPHIPPDIRPARGLQNYHILWEAEWGKEYPVDPLLLRRIGTTGDMWLVVAAWDLTPVERAVLATKN